MQPLQRVGVVLLQEEQVLLSALQLILQRYVRRRHGGGHQLPNLEAQRAT